MQQINRIICSSSSIKPSVKKLLLPQNEPLKGTYSAVKKTAGNRIYKQFRDCFCPQILLKREGKNTTAQTTINVIQRQTIIPAPITLPSLELSFATFLDITSGNPLVTSEQSRKNALSEI